MTSNGTVRSGSLLTLAATLALAFHAGVLLLWKPVAAGPSFRTPQEQFTEVDLIQSKSELQSGNSRLETQPIVAEPAPPQPLQTPLPSMTNEAPTPQPQEPPASSLTTSNDSIQKPTAAPQKRALNLLQSSSQSTPSNREASATSTPKSSGKIPQSPVYKVLPNIKYPTESRAAGEEGTVILRITVNASGKPIAVSIVTSSGYARLDRAAVEGGWRCRISNSGESAQFEAPLRFNLKE